MQTDLLWVREVFIRFKSSHIKTSQVEFTIFDNVLALIVLMIFSAQH